jgi:hypothetical protein
MTEQPNNPPLASVEADLFSVLFGFHKKIVTLLRESSLDDEKMKAVGDRIKKLLDEATADIKQSQPINLSERLEAAYQEAKRLVDELRQSQGDKGAKPKPRRQNKP